MAGKLLIFMWVHLYLPLKSISMGHFKLLIVLLLAMFIQTTVLAQPPSRGRAIEMVIAGDNWLQMLDLEKAIEFYSSAISLDPGFADAYVKRANAYAIAGRNTEAQADFNMAININPYIDYLYDSRAKVKILVADFKGALIDADLVNQFQTGEKDLVQGYILTDMRNLYPGTLPFLDSMISENPTVSKYFVYRALARLEGDDNSGAMADVNQALEINPNSAMAHNMLGLLQLQNGNFGGALASFEAAIAADENYAAAYLNRGRTHHLMGNVELALADMDYAVALDTNFTLAYFSRAMVSKGLGKANEAIADYDKVIALQPTFADAYFARGFARKMLGDNAGAIRDYDAAILYDPNDATTFNNRGILKVMADDYFGAIKDFRTSISLQPDYAVAYHNLGMSLIMNYSRTEGCEYLQTSMNKGFDTARDEYKYFCTQ